MRHAHRQLDERVERYRGGRPPLDVAGRTVIIVDDGLATGGTARSALRAVRARGARRLVLAVPVGAPESVAALQAEADHVVCVLQPRDLRAVGEWYESFRPTDDGEVLALLAAGAPEAAGPTTTRRRRPRGCWSPSGPASP